MAEPRFSAAHIVRMIRRKGGRAYRMPDTVAFVLTDDPKLARELLELGGSIFNVPGLTPDAHTSPLGGYRRTPGGKTEWDILIHMIPVRGEQTIWEALGEDPYKAAPIVSLSEAQLVRSDG
jgi:hypothetical protein